jgi:hypothetical protein
VRDGEAYTAFTGRLISLLREGDERAGELLTLGEIYRRLNSQLGREGLPLPQQRGTETADLLGLVRNRHPAAASISTLPTLLPSQSLADISGSDSDPVQHLAFSGIQFTGTTWLSPTTSQGYADEQNGTFLTGTWTRPSDELTSCSSGCTDFEATRQYWSQMPAAVQVAAATNIAFSGDTFTDLGQVGLGIGNDPDANASGVGLAASDITVSGNAFTDDAGAGIVVGGVQANAHHPSNPDMTDENITISDNRVNGTQLQIWTCNGGTNQKWAVT